MSPVAARARLFWTSALSILILDVVTKYFAERELMLHVPRRVIGEFVRFTLAYNTGAAFSMSVGSPAVSRAIFGLFAAFALLVLWWLSRTGPANERLRHLALGLAWGGAAGNLVDRVRHAKGVVDFLDIGIGSTRFWTFNVADAGVSVGAVLLAYVLFQDERRERLQRQDEPERPSAG